MQTGVGIEQAVECFRRGSSMRLPFSASVKALKKLQTVREWEWLVARLTPFVEDARDQLVRTHADIEGADRRSERTLPTGRVR